MHRTQSYLTGHSGAATPSSAYSHPGFLASDQNICGRRQKKGKKEKRNTQRTIINSIRSRYRKQMLWFETNHPSTLFFIQLKWKRIPFPFHLHTTLCGRRAKAPAIFSTKSPGRARIPMPKETTTTPASAASTQRRRPCGQNTHSCPEGLLQKGLPTLASVRRKLSTEKMKRSPPGAQSYTVFTTEWTLKPLWFLYPAREKLVEHLLVSGVCK